MKRQDKGKKDREQLKVWTEERRTDNLVTVFVFFMVVQLAGYEWDECITCMYSETLSRIRLWLYWFTFGNSMNADKSILHNHK